MFRDGPPAFVHPLGEPVRPPFQGWGALGLRVPRAMPWAAMDRPVGAEDEKAYPSGCAQCERKPLSDDVWGEAGRQSAFAAPGVKPKARRAGSRRTTQALNGGEPAGACWAIETPAEVGTRPRS